MGKVSKIIVTIVCVIVFIALSGVVSGIRSDAGFATPGIFGIILMLALIGALRAVWKNEE